MGAEAEEMDSRAGTWLGWNPCPAAYKLGDLGQVAYCL